MLYDNTITLSDIIEKHDGVCDIKYKDKTLPLDLILELDNNNTCDNTRDNFQEEYTNCIDDTLYDFLLKNERRIHKVKKSAKRKPMKLRMTLRRKF